ncbi:MAG: hypothetical protein AB8B83_02430 [Bdellovibrionales bacterium]
MNDGHIPIESPLQESMRCCMFTNANGDIMIVHETPLLSEIQWVEFYPETGAFNLVHEEGRIQALGIELADNAVSNISKGQEVTLVHFESKAVAATQKATLLIQKD